MSHSHPSGLLAAYNSLTDKHLAGYFNNTRIRRHLLRSGLITRSGRILSEKEYKLNIMKRDHQRYIRECLAQAIFHKVLDMERYHQLEIKKKLETLARKERIQRFKGEPTRWSTEKSRPVLSPHPPGGPKTNRGHSVLVEDGPSSPATLTAPRPYTAPGIMQPPIRLQPLPSNPAVGAVPKVTSGSRSKTSPLENGAPFPVMGKKAVMKFRNSMDNSQGMSQYQLLSINSYMMPVPPPSPPPNGKITRENRSETWRRRRFHPTTAPNSLEPVFTRDSRRINKAPLHSNAVITMIYLGKNVRLSYDHPDFRDEIKIYQQHCGGENLCIYKGKLLEKETFQFISKRHHGFPFSLTFFLNGMQVNRLSSCCEYKHRKGSRLGGKRGYFGFVCVERSSPCYKCIIAMGLDKKLTSPKPKKQASVEEGEELQKDEGKLRKDRAYMKTRRNEMEGGKSSASVFFAAEEEKTGVEEVRTAVEEMECKGKQHVWEDDQENIYKYEYEEDFEVEEEKQDKEAHKEGRADDQMNGMSKSPSDNEKDNLDPEKESETSSQKAPDADDSVKDEGDGCSESELEEDEQDIKTASSSSSRSHPYSSCSEDESALGDKETHADGSPNLSVRSSSSQDVSETDEPEKSQLPIEDSLKVEDQKIIKANMGTKPLLTEESLEDVLEEETKKETQVITEGLSEKSRQYVSKEEKENYRHELWKGSTAKVKDKMAGPCRVEKGVGQTLAEAVESGCHSPCDAESGVSSTDEGEMPVTELETDIGTAPNRNLVVEESTVLNSNKESKPKKEEAVEEDEVPQHRDADTVEEKRGATLWGKAGVDEVLLGEWKPTAEQAALAELFIKEREIPQGIAGRAEVEEDKELNKEELHSTGKKAARASEGLNGEEAPEKQALMLTVLETEKAASKEKQGSEKVAFASQAAAPKSECIQEVRALREAVMQEKKEAERGAAASEAESEKPNVEDSEDKASIDQGDTGPEQDTVSETEDGLEEAILGGEEPAKTREAVMRTETPLSSSTSDKAETTRMKVSEESLEELCKKDEKRKEAETEVESNKGDDRKETLPEELDAEGKRMKAERPKTPLGETESEKEEVTRANALQDEDILEEERKFKGQDGEIVKELRPEKETQGPQNEIECDVENETPMEASELIEDTMQQEESLREREVTMSETAPGFEKSPENVIAMRKEGGGERLRESGDTEYKGKAEVLCRENVALSEQEEGSSLEGEGALGTPESDPEGQAQAAEVMITATGEAQECIAKDEDELAGLERREEEESLKERQEVGAMAMTQEYISEGDPMMAEKLCEEVMDEDPEEEVGKDCTFRTPVLKAGHTEGDGSLQGGMAVADEDPQGGASEMAEEKRGVLADLNTAKGKTEANTAASFSDVTGEETWHKVSELLGKTAAAEKVVAEEIALSREGVPAVGEVTVTEASEAEVEALGEASVLEGKAPQLGRDQKEGEVGVEARMGSHGGAQESGEAEDFRLRLSQERESEQSRESLQDMEILPVKADCPGTQEKQEKHTVQGESENIDVSLNKKKA